MALVGGNRCVQTFVLQTKGLSKYRIERLKRSFLPTALKKTGLTILILSTSPELMIFIQIHHVKRIISSNNFTSLLGSFLSASTKLASRLSAHYPMLNSMLPASGFCMFSKDFCLFADLTAA